MTAHLLGVLRASQGESVHLDDYAANVGISRRAAAQLARRLRESGLVYVSDPCSKHGVVVTLASARQRVGDGSGR